MTTSVPNDLSVDYGPNQNQDEFCRMMNEATDKVITQIQKGSTPNFLSSCFFGSAAFLNTCFLILGCARHNIAIAARTPDADSFGYPRDFDILNKEVATVLQGSKYKPAAEKWKTFLMQKLQESGSNIIEQQTKTSKLVIERLVISENNLTPIPQYYSASEIQSKLDTFPPLNKPISQPEPELIHAVVLEELQNDSTSPEKKEWIDLSHTLFWKTNDSTSIPCIFHLLKHRMQTVDLTINELFEKIIKHQYKTRDELIQDVSRFRYLSAHLVRFERGSASCDESMEKALYKINGLTIDPESTRGIDLAALTSPSFSDFHDTYQNALRFIE